jgi:hypothetical protein
MTPDVLDIYEEFAVVVGEGWRVHTDHFWREH